MDRKFITILGLFIAFTAYGEPAFIGEIPLLRKQIKQATDVEVKNLRDNGNLEYLNYTLYSPKIQVGDEMVTVPNIFLRDVGEYIRVRGKYSDTVRIVIPCRENEKKGTGKFTGQIKTVKGKIKAGDKEYLPFIGNIGRLLLARHPNHEDTKKFFKFYFNIKLDSLVPQNTSTAGFNPLFAGADHTGGFQGAAGVPFGSGYSYRVVIQDWLADPEEKKWSEICQERDEDGTKKLLCMAVSPQYGNLILNDGLKALKNLEEVKPIPIPITLSVAPSATLDEVLEKARAEGREHAFVMETQSWCGPCQRMIKEELPKLVQARENLGMYLVNDMKWRSGAYPYMEVYRVSDGQKIFTHTGGCSAGTIISAIQKN